MSQSIAVLKPSPFAVFRNPSFTRMWLAQLISTIGDSFTMIAAGIYIYRISGSALQVGLMLMATSIPTLLIGMIAGVFVDRYDRKKIMIIADALRGVLIFLVPFLVAYHVNWLYVIVMLSSAIGTFFTPAYDSVVPEMASDEDLAAANSMIAISSFGSTAIGFAASGLLAAYSIEWAFFIDAITFLFSAALLMTIKVAPSTVTEETNVHSVIRNLQGGVQYLFSNPILRSMLLIGTVYSFMIGLGNTLLLPFATDVLKATEFEYGLQEGLTSIGFVVGSLLLARYFERYRDGVWVIISLIGMGITYLLYSFSTSVMVAIVIITFAGVMNAPYGIARRTILQRNSDREVRGRVMGSFMTFSHVMILLGMAAAGLADIYGARLMMQVAAYLNLVCAAIALLAPGIGRPAAEWLRAVRALGKVSQAPALAVGRAATLADMDKLVASLPTLSALSSEERKSLLKNMRYIEAGEGTAVVRKGETSDAAYFLLEGGAVAGWDESGHQRILEVLRTGDFFGEIAALTGIARTANVVTDRDSALLRVPADTLRAMSKNVTLNRVFVSKMTERMLRMEMIELPKMMSYDQKVLRELRTAEAAGD